MWCRATRPGPTSYTIRTTLGRPTEVSHLPSSPSYTCGKLSHEGANILRTAGSGKLEAPIGGVGRAEPLSGKRTEPRSAGFGTSTRTATDAMYSTFTFRPR